MDNSFFDRFKKDSTPKDIHHFNMYVNKDESKEFWKFIEKAEQNNISPSALICHLVSELYKRGTLDELLNERDNADTIENMGAIKALTKIADLYNRRGADEFGSDFSKALARKFYEGNISPNELINLMVFILELNAVVRRTDIFKKFIRANPGMVLESLRDFNNPSKVETFKQILKNEFFVDINLFESEHREKERKERERQRNELLLQEIKEWEIRNPGKKWCYRNMTDEEIEVSKRIGKGELVFKNGEYILIEPVNDSDDDIDLYDDNTIETNIRDP